MTVAPRHPHSSGLEDRSLLTTQKGPGDKGRRRMKKRARDRDGRARLDSRVLRHEGRNPGGLPVRKHCGHVRKRKVLPASASLPRTWPGAPEALTPFRDSTGSLRIYRPNLSYTNLTRLGYTKRNMITTLIYASLRSLSENELH